MNNRCLKKALQLLSRREHSCDELCKKLQGRGFPRQKVKDTIGVCLRSGYLNDERFAQTYVDHLHHKGYGIRYIEDKLYAKGITDEIIKTTVGYHCKDLVQLSACRKALAKKIKHHRVKKISDDQRSKLQRFLLGRGYSPQIVMQALASDQ